MKKPKLIKSSFDKHIMELMYRTDKKTLAIWACGCVKRVLPYFEKKYKKDKRPRLAFEACRSWTKNGIFKMSTVRKISLDSHAAAREIENDDIARSVARACGQAVATTHVKSHSIAAAIYCATAVYYASKTNSEVRKEKERKWQLDHLIKLRLDS